MEDISNVHVTDYIPTIYTTPATLHYKQNNQPKKANVFLERNGVVIVLYNKTKDMLVLVKQFRPSVFHQLVPEAERTSVDTNKYPPKQAITLEFCAGLEDKDVPSEIVAQEEILEECGYQVPLEDLQQIFKFCNLSETTGARSTFFYCEVTEAQRVSQGGGSVEEHEIVEVIEMKVEDVLNYSKQSYVCSPMNFMFLFNWFLYHKYPKTCQITP